MRLTSQVGSRKARRPATRLRLERLEERSVPSFGFGWAFQVGTVTGNAIVADGGGNLYVTGSFSGTNVDFAPRNATPYYLSSQSGGSDIFAAKYSAADGTLQWVTNLGRTDTGLSAIAVQGGNVYVSGPFTFAGVSTALAQLDAGAGSVLNTVSSQIIGASHVKVAASPFTGNVYLTGNTSSSQASVTQLDPTLSVLWTRTTSGGSVETQALSHGVPAIGNGLAVYNGPNNGPESVYLTGRYSGTTTFGTTTKTSVAGSQDIFVWKLNADGTTAAAASLGTSGTDSGNGLAVDAAGNAHVTGRWNGNTAIFVAKLTPTLAVSWNQFISAKGGSSSGASYAVAVDGAGNVYTTGDFGGQFDFDPGSGTYVLKTGAKVADTFLSKLNANGSFVAVADIAQGPPTSSINVYSAGHCIALDNASPGAPDVYAVGYFKGTRDFDPTTGTYSLTADSSIPFGGWSGFVSKVTQTSPLLALGGAATGTMSPHLTNGALQPVVAAAIDRWAAAGLDTARLDVMRHATITIADLGGLYLGLADATIHTIRIDDDAAGYGWFVDPTPGRDSEFHASDAKAMRNRMDLLSVVAHELGHLVGVDDDHNSGHAADVMGDSLSAGTRRTPTAADVPLIGPAEQRAFRGQTALRPASRHR